MIGSSVRLTIHDAQGTPHRIEGKVVHVASQPIDAISPGAQKRWEGLIAVTDASGVSRVVVYDLTDVEMFAPEVSLPAPTSTFAGTHKRRS